MLTDDQISLLVVAKAITKNELRTHFGLPPLGVIGDVCVCHEATDPLVAPPPPPEPPPIIIATRGGHDAG